MATNDIGPRSCHSCRGTGEIGTDTGVMACPDCGGEGVLPSAETLLEWRLRDIERLRCDGSDALAADVRFLVAELRTARRALNEVLALAHDDPDAPEVLRRVERIASRALSK